MMKVPSKHSHHLHHHAPHKHDHVSIHHSTNVLPLSLPLSLLVMLSWLTTINGAAGNNGSCFVSSLSSPHLNVNRNIDIERNIKMSHRISTNLKLTAMAGSTLVTSSCATTTSYKSTTTSTRRLIYNHGSKRNNYYINSSSKQGTTQLQSTSLSSSSSSSHYSSSSSSKKITSSIIAILTATTLNLLGFTMTSPLTPTIGQHFNLEPSASFGTLTSAYPLGMLFGLYIWPKLSDLPNVRRKNVMVVTLLGSTFGLMLQAFCILLCTSTTGTTGTTGNFTRIIHKKTSLLLFLISRVMTGIFAGCAPVAKAYLADVGDTNGQLSVYLGWRDAASTLAYILGPGLGGILFHFLLTTGTTTAATTTTIRTIKKTVASSTISANSQALGYVISLSAFASFIATLLIVSFVQDQPIHHNNDNDDNNNKMMMKISNQGSKGTTSSTTNNNDYNANNTDAIENHQNQHQLQKQLQHHDYDIISCPLGTKLWTGVATVCLISFLYHIADSTFFAFFPAYLQSSSLQFNPQQIGAIFTLLSSITFCFSATSISSKLIQLIGVVKTCSLGLGLVGIGLSLLSMSSSSSSLSSSSSSMLSIFTFLSAGIYFCGVPLYGPTIPTMLLQCVPPYQRGTVMGLDGIINTIARIFSPIVMGDIYKRFGPSLTFKLAGMSVFGSSILALIRRWIVICDQKQPEGSSRREK